MGVRSLSNLSTAVWDGGGSAKQACRAVPLDIAPGTTAGLSGDDNYRVFSTAADRQIASAFAGLIHTQRRLTERRHHPEPAVQAFDPRQEQPPMHMRLA